MGQSASQMVAEARARIESLSPDQVAFELLTEGVRVIDIRERDELVGHGTIAGAMHTPRGLLEFHADPSSPCHRAEFDPGARIILVCDFGGRSALATETLQRMGYRRVAHLAGGLDAWAAQGFPVEPAHGVQAGMWKESPR